MPRRAGLIGRPVGDAPPGDPTLGFVAVIETDASSRGRIIGAVSLHVPVVEPTAVADTLGLAHEPCLLGAICAIDAADGSGLDLVRAFRQRRGRHVPILGLIARTGFCNDAHLLDVACVERPVPAQNVLHFLENAGVLRWSRIRSGSLRRAPLLPRQPLRVLLLSSLGLDRDRIAEELGVTLNTVKTHISKILDWFRSLGGAAVTLDEVLRALDVDPSCSEDSRRVRHPRTGDRPSVGPGLAIAQAWPRWKRGAL